MTTSKRLLSRRADAQQRLAVAQHVLEQRRFGLDQVQRVAVVEEGAQLVDAVYQRGVVARISSRSRSRYNATPKEGEQTKASRANTSARRRVREWRRVHGWVSKR